MVTRDVRALLVVALIILVAGCGGTGPSAADRPGDDDRTPPDGSAAAERRAVPGDPSAGAGTARPADLSHRSHPSPRPRPPTSAPAPLAARPGTPPVSVPPVPAARSAAPRPVRYVFPIAGCAARYSRSHHDYPATDIFAPPGCLVVSPVTGRVDEINRVDRWSAATDRPADRGGLSISVVGTDGVRYYGSHLSSVGAHLRPGTPVSAGQPLGRVGISGNARGTPAHLHFGLSWPTRPGIWWIRRGVVYPWPYLDAWRRGRMLSPVPAVAAARRRAR